MKTIQASIYARVSSEQQAAAHTIESQLAELAERVQSDGTPVPAKRQSVDDGYKRATLVRPALERLRDLATRRVVNGVHVPFARPIGARLRLSNLLIDEWHRAGAEAVFLNHPLGQSPEADLLLQVPREND